MSSKLLRIAGLAALVASLLPASGVPAAKALLPPPSKGLVSQPCGDPVCCCGVGPCCCDTSCGLTATEEQTERAEPDADTESRWCGDGRRLPPHSPWKKLSMAFSHKCKPQGSRGFSGFAAAASSGGSLYPRAAQAVTAVAVAAEMPPTAAACGCRCGVRLPRPVEGRMPAVPSRPRTVALVGCCDAGGLMAFERFAHALEPTRWHHAAPPQPLTVGRHLASLCCWQA